ncbi:exodeoxyribonuclease III [Croceicoccus sp. F390]|uniref:Exodeoxyribonuclease III n=1 Tax=Croceicoccus esteveae TaxID=3075597 RepID=A0ABU2ZIL2_9SPHN|nr:exodeoxyribonuclease III [Croceicoccus sp. F390]MDT0576211.1 exodeoxyribonuclease III [Croceicoccus sp. F390]
MKIASFNINGVKARLPRLLEWLEETQPDIACLQEIKSSDGTFPADAFAPLGYEAIWHGQKGFNGVAVLSRQGSPAVLVKTGLDGDEDDTQARYLECRSQDVHIACIYLPNGNPQPGPKFLYKLRWFERLRARMAHLRDLEVPAVVIGDFNVIPTDADIWSPAAMGDDALTQAETRDAWFRLVYDGWTDAIRHFYPQGGLWTFWDYQAGAWQRDHGFRIDHALLSPKASDRLVAAGVDRSHRGRERASDHAPIWVNLRDA